MSTNNLTQSAWGEHLRGCADLAKEIAVRLDLRDDAARQACLATIIISADRHNLFLEPTPRNGQPKPEPSAAKPEPAKVGVPAAQKDAQAAAKADAQIKNIDPNPTPEKAEAVNRTVLLEGIEKVRQLMVKEGRMPTLTPKALNEFISENVKQGANLGSLDLDELETLTKKLSVALDMFRENKKALEADAPF